VSPASSSTTSATGGVATRKVSAEPPELVAADGDAWHEWLGRHHETSTGVCLVLASKSTTDPTSLTYDVALDEALCHGWIDGQVGRRDEETFR